MEIDLKNLSFSYDKKRGEETLTDINVSFQKGEFIGIAGHSGSGKSTFVQVIKGLLQPTKGDIFIDGKNPQKRENSDLYHPIGFLFQYPEHQLFASTVWEDIAFGLKNQLVEWTDSELDDRIQEAMAYVNLPFESFKNRHPLDLSGGEKRRVALAGVLALQPKVLILDEPTVGLDFPSRKALFNVLHRLHQQGITVLLVTHRWEDIVSHTDRLIVLRQGRIIMDSQPLSILSHDDFLTQCGLEPLDFIRLYQHYQKRGYPSIHCPWDVDQMANAILKSVEVGKR